VVVYFIYHAGRVNSAAEIVKDDSKSRLMLCWVPDNLNSLKQLTLCLDNGQCQNLFCFVLVELSKNFSGEV
jgi:hypothetical protein